MPIHVTGFKADHKSLGEFLLSDQLRDAVHQGAEDVAAIASRTAGITKIRDGYYVEPGPDVIVTINQNPRLSERVRNDHPAAAADEFGSGKKRKREQGGSSNPNRTLGKAGAQVGDNIKRGRKG